MRYRKLDKDDDYTFGKGKAGFYIDCAEAVGQAVITRLRLWLEEWFLDKKEGTPYQTLILGKYTEATRDQAIKERILGTQGVVRLVEYESIFEPETRHFTVQATIDTIYGQTSFREII